MIVLRLNYRLPLTVFESLKKLRFQTNLSIIAGYRHQNQHEVSRLGKGGDGRRFGGSAPGSGRGDTVVWLATLPDDGPEGGYFRDRHPLAW